MSIGGRGGREIYGDSDRGIRDEMSQASWHTPVASTLGSLRQEDWEPTLATQPDPVSNTKIWGDSDRKRVH
jgi:hypothetical protein